MFSLKLNLRYDAKLKETHRSITIAKPVLSHVTKLDQNFNKYESKFCCQNEPWIRPGWRLGYARPMQLIRSGATFLIIACHNNV